MGFKLLFHSALDSAGVPINEGLEMHGLAEIGDDFTLSLAKNSHFRQDVVDRPLFKKKCHFFSLPVPCSAVVAIKVVEVL